MRIELKVKEQMVKRFQLLPLALKLATAAERLSPNRLGVVVNRSQNPITVVTSEDITRAQEHGYQSLRGLAENIPRVMVVGAQTPMDLVVRGLAPSLIETVRDIVVVGRAGIVGVVPVEDAVSFMKRRKAFKPELKILSGRGLLAGAYVLTAATGASVGRWFPELHLEGRFQDPDCFKYLCVKCEFTNCLPFHPRRGHEPECQNDDPKVDPHPLKIAW